MERFGLYIDGRWVDTEKRLSVVDKYRNEPFAEIGLASPEQVSQAIAAAQRAWRDHPLPPQERFRILSRTSVLLGEHIDDLAATIAREGGKPLKLARGEVQRAMQTFQVAAEEAKRITGEVVPVDAAPGAENRFAFTLRVPVGVVAAISPFNFPLNLVAHKVAPAIAAGNAVVLKPASQTPITAAKLCRLLEAAGLPAGFLNLVVGSGSTVGEQILQDPRIAFYTFTGSPGVGERLRQAIGLRRATLELGSNSATIVHLDADLDKAASRCASAAFAHAGQVCISLQRLLVHEQVWDAFLSRFLDRVRELKVGDPMDPATDVGPMISEAEAERATAWIEEAKQQGARVLLGGGRQGVVLEPTVLTDVQDQMKVVCEEVFAPVVTLVPYKGLGEAIARVNSSKYGLQAGIFTTSISTAMEAARKVEVGGVMINDTSSFRADLMPYGGVKLSGNGREGPRYAIEEMTELKVVVMDL
ncbi:MAG: aldehyde dehydrogenase family protein [Symbiobacteriia bacterium]